MKNTLICLAAILSIQSVAQQKTPVPKSIPAGKSLLAGVFTGVSGTSIVIQNNAAADLTLVAKKETGKSFAVTEFNFPAPLADETKFTVTVKKSPAGFTTSVYSGSTGSMPQQKERLRIGSDYTYDLMSRSADDKTFGTFYESFDPVIGGAKGEEGRYVAFVSAAQGIAGSTGKHRQIFWRDRNEGTIKIISLSPKGEEGNNDSFLPAISMDGKSVVFESLASNLVGKDGNGIRDIFLWNAITNTVKRVSITANGEDPNAESYEPAISGDGRIIAFTSTASNISSSDKGISNNNVFVYNIEKETTKMISVDPKNRKGGGGSNPSVSYDGSRIAFYSNTGLLTPGDGNGFWDIFLYEENATGLKRISLSSTGSERNQGQESANRIVWPSISGNGNFIAYSTTASNMTEADNNNMQDVFVYDVAANKTVIASRSASEPSGNNDSPIGQGEKIAISFDGQWVAFTSKTTNLGAPAINIIMHNLLTGINRAVTTVNGSSIARPAISASGSYIVFGMGAPLDSRYAATGIFASYTGLGPTRFGPE